MDPHLDSYLDASSKQCISNIITGEQMLASESTHAEQLTDKRCTEQLIDKGYSPSIQLDSSATGIGYFRYINVHNYMHVCTGMLECTQILSGSRCTESTLDLMIVSENTA